MDNITTVANDPLMNKIALARQSDNNGYDIHIYNGKSFDHIFTVNINLEPDNMELYKNQLYIAGTSTDTTGASKYALYIVNLDNQSVFSKNLHQGISGNREMHINNSKIYMLNAPGDSIITVTEITKPTMMYYDTIIYGHAGTDLQVPAFYWWHEHSHLYYQPNVNDSGFHYVYRYHIESKESETIPFHRKLDYYWPVYPGSFGSDFFHSGAKHDHGIHDTVFILNYNNELFAVPVDARPILSFPDYRCRTGLEENPEANIRIKAYPNPTNNELNISISGLESDTPYTIRIFGADGQLFTEEVQAKDVLRLPFSEYPSGMYYIHVVNKSGQDVIKKIVKQ